MKKLLAGLLALGMLLLPSMAGATNFVQPQMRYDRDGGVVSLLGPDNLWNQLCTVDSVAHLCNVPLSVPVFGFDTGMGGAPGIVPGPQAGDAAANKFLSPTGWRGIPGASIPPGTLNKFRNGTMDIWQRGTSGLPATTAGNYTADGWIGQTTGANAVASQQAGRLLTVHSLRLTGTTGITDAVLKQRIESVMSAPLSGATVTVQAWIYNGTGASLTPQIAIKHPNSIDNYATTTTDVAPTNLQTVANGGWTQVGYTFNLMNGALGLEVTFDFGGAINSAGGSYVQMTELDIRETPSVTLGLNAAPPPPELRSLPVEAILNDRYYWAPSLPVIIRGSASGSGVGAYQTVYFPVIMRPTVTYMETGSYCSSLSNVASATPVVSQDSARFVIGSSGAGDFFCIYNNRAFGAEL